MTKIDSVKVSLGSTVLIMFWFIVYITLSVSKPIAEIKQTVTQNSQKLDTLISASFSPKVAKELNHLYQEKVNADKIR